MLFQKHSVPALLTALLLLCAAHLQATTYQFVGTYSDWTDATAWSPAGIPGSTDTVILNTTESSTLVLNVDVTVHTLIIERISQIAGNGVGYSTLTVQNRLLCKFIPSFGCNLVIGAGATADFNNDNFSSPFAGIYCYGDVTVDGALTTSVEFFNAPRITINGTFTHLNGGLGGEINVSPGATLTLNSPNKLIQLGFVNNAGTFNWQAGDIYSSSSLINTGLWNISSNDSIYTGDFTQGSSINNTGQIRIAAAVERVSVQWRLNNQGSVVLEGASTFHTLALRNQGTVAGPAGSTLELSGYYFDTGNVLETNSTMNVSTLRTNYLTALDIRPGANVGQIANFILDAGPLNLALPLPPAANYVLNCQTELAADQVFTGNVSVGGTFSGSKKVTFNTTNATLNNATFFNALTEISSGSVVILNTGGFFGNVVNNGVLNWVSNGLLVLNQPGLTNNGSFNISTPNTQVYSQGFGNQEVNLLNNGTITLDVPAVGGLLQTYLNGFRNNGIVTVGSNDTLQLGGGLIEQNSQLTGAAGSCLELNSGITRLAATAVTSGFSALSTLYSEVLLTEGTTLNNIGSYRFTESTVDVDVVLAPEPTYVFERSMVRLSTTFQPASPLVVRNTTFEGSGSVRIPNLLDWEGGTFDVPLRIEENATATIRESDTQRPIISSPFTNRGTVTLSGGIIEINTGFFSNKGTWQVNSTEDVIIDGFTPYTNDGVFAICGNQPIQIIFNVPFVNQENGTFKGEGTYTFNAEYTNNGTAAPGCSPGVLEIDSDFQTGAGLDVEIEGTEAGQYDLFRIRGDLQVSGHLWVFVPTGAAPAGPVTIVETDGNISGTFDSTDLPEGYTLTYNAQSIVVNTTGAVSTQDLAAAQGWRIHPTLVTDRLRWQADQPARSDRWLRIWNTQGQLVQTSLVPSNTAQLEVLVGDLAPGVYTVTNDDGARSRFVKM